MRCTCTCALNPDCPVDHLLLAESLDDAVRERIAATPYSDLRDACGDFLFQRSKAQCWPHGYSFGRWYRDRVEAQIEHERRLA